MKRIAKILMNIRGRSIKPLEYLNTSMYMKRYVKYLRKLGIQIDGMPNYINHTVHFDGFDYSLIRLGNGCTISMGVLLLTHDGSMHTIFAGVKNCDPDIYKKIREMDAKTKLVQKGTITIGPNSFIGARATLLPGTNIGKNVLVGACAVLKGDIPDYAIVVGNPARVVGHTQEWFINKAHQLTDVK